MMIVSVGERIFHPVGQMRPRSEDIRCRGKYELDSRDRQAKGYDEDGEIIGDAKGRCQAVRLDQG